MTGLRTSIVFSSFGFKNNKFQIWFNIKNLAFVIFRMSLSLYNSLFFAEIRTKYDAVTRRKTIDIQYESQEVEPEEVPEEIMEWTTSIADGRDCNGIE